jgi:hypothetical protein
MHEAIRPAWEAPKDGTEFVCLTYDADGGGGICFSNVRWNTIRGRFEGASTGRVYHFNVWCKTRYTARSIVFADADSKDYYRKFCTVINRGGGSI